MDEGTWVGVTLAYTCPACDKPDQQALVFYVERYDRNAILGIVQERKGACRLCNTILPKNLSLEFDICSGTLEQLRKAGYPAPSVQ